MTHLVHQDFRSPHVEPRRPSLARRIARRYQLVELTIIIGTILSLWGLFSLSRAHTQAPMAWPQDVPELDARLPRR
jgi:hypothetical protein